MLFLLILKPVPKKDAGFAMTNTGNHLFFEPRVVGIRNKLEPGKPSSPIVANCPQAIYLKMGIEMYWFPRVNKKIAGINVKSRDDTKREKKMFPYNKSVHVTEVNCPAYNI